MIRIKNNENLHNLINYINDCSDYINWKDFVTFALDYNCYSEFYANLPVLKLLVHAHDISIENGTWKKPE